MLMLHALSIGRQRVTTRPGESGQATAEYALVIVGAATLAGLMIAWAAGTGRIAELLNAVIDAVIGKIG